MSEKIIISIDGDLEHIADEVTRKLMQAYGTDSGIIFGMGRTDMTSIVRMVLTKLYEFANEGQEKTKGGDKK